MIIRATASLLLLGAAACDDTPTECFLSAGGGEGECTGGRGGQPGEALAEGGEIRHERVYIGGGAPQAWIQLYQYKGPPAALNAPLPAPELPTRSSPKPRSSVAGSPAC